MARTLRYNREHLQQRKLPQRLPNAAQQALLGTKGGVAGGKPYVQGALSPAQQQQLTGAPGVSHASRQLTSAQERRRMIRQKLAEAAGLVKPGQAFHAYGPHKTAGADQILKGGSSITRGYGSAPSHQQMLMRRRRR